MRSRFTKNITYNNKYDKKRTPKHRGKNEKCVAELLGYVKRRTTLNPTSTLTLRYDATEFRNNRDKLGGGPNMPCYKQLRRIESD